MRWLLAGMFVLVLSTMPAVGQAPEAGRNQIVTMGMGRIDVAPDQAALTVGVQAQHATAAEATAVVSRVASQVLARWQALGVRQEDVRTSAIQVAPVFTQPRDGGAPRIAGYRATYLVTMTMTNLSVVGRAIDAAVGGGANTIHGLSFGLRDPSKTRAEALAMAVRDARSKAEAMAQAAGLRIKGIERITEASAVVQTREARVQAAPAPSVPIEPGLISVTAQVTVVFNF